MEPNDHTTTDPEYSSTDNPVRRDGVLTVGTDAVLVFDRENPDGWIQSDVGTSLVEVR